MNFWDTISTDLKNRFRRNFRMLNERYMLSDRHMNFERFLNRNNTDRSIIRKAFTWSESPEGFEFWNMIDRMWFNLLMAEKAGNEKAKARFASKLGHIQLD